MGQNYLEDERKTILINEGFGFENLSQLRELYIERISINSKESEIKKSRHKRDSSIFFFLFSYSNQLVL